MIREFIALSVVVDAEVELKKVDRYFIDVIIRSRSAVKVFF